MKKLYTLCLTVIGVPALLFSQYPGSGNALRLPVSRHIDFGNVSTYHGLSEISFGGWFKPTTNLSPNTTSSDVRSWICKGSLAGGTTNTLYLFVQGNNSGGRNIVGGIATSATSSVVANVASTSLTLGVWNHVFYTWKSGDSARLYVNGIQVGAGLPPSGTINTTTFPLKFGSSNYTSEDNFIGDMDEISFWNKQLSVNDIRAMMCSKITASHYNYSNLLNYYRFDQVNLSGSPNVPDLKGSNGGTVTGSGAAASIVKSGAALGDTSIYVYGGSSITLDGTGKIIADSFIGSPVGVHLYRVNERPKHDYDPFQFTDTFHYEGLFFSGGTSPTARIRYDYSTSALSINDFSKLYATIRRRNNNEANTWAFVGQINDTANSLITIYNSGRSEYIFGLIDQFFIWKGNTTQWNLTTNWEPVLSGYPSKYIIPGSPSGGKFPKLIDHVFVDRMILMTGAKMDYDTFRLFANNYLENNGTIYIGHNGAQVLDQPAVQAGNGTWVIKRTTGHSDPWIYNYWSSPVDSTRIDSLYGHPARRYRLPAGSSVIDDWIKVPNGTWMQRGVGYTATGPANVTFRGKTNWGTLKVAIKDNGSPNHWNLLGNPFPSSLSLYAFDVTNSGLIAGNYYVWSQQGTAMSNYTTADGYLVINAAGSNSGMGVNRAGLSLNDFELPSCNGFMVEALGNDSVEFHHGMAGWNNYNMFKREPEMQRAWIELKNNSDKKSGILTALIEDATEERDLNYDARWFNSGQDFSLYTLLKNEPYIIQAWPMGELKREIALGVKVDQAGDYTIRIAETDKWPGNTSIMLEDRNAHKLIDLKRADYTFKTTGKVDFQGRFYLHFVPGGEELQKPGLENVKAWLADGKIMIDRSNPFVDIASVQLFDITGKVIISNFKSGSEGRISIDSGLLSPGIYLIKLTTTSGESRGYKVVH